MVEMFFTFWDTESLRRHLRLLEKTGIVLSCQPNAKDWDRTKHYRIDREALDAEIDKYLSKKAEKAHSERTGNMLTHRTGEIAASNRADVNASKGAQVNASKGEHVNASKSTQVNGSYKEQTSLTDLSTEPAAESVSEIDEEEAVRLEFERRYPTSTQLLKDKLTQRADAAGTGKYYECLREDPRRLAWLVLPPSRVRELITQATEEFRAGKKFTYEFIKALDKAIKPKPASANAEDEPPEVPLSLEERRRITEEANAKLPPSLRKNLAARGHLSEN